jgi:endo-1,4-beta-D-glucanase Y
MTYKNAKGATIILIAIIGLASSASAQMTFSYNVNYPNGMNGIAPNQTTAVSNLNSHWAAWKTNRLTSLGAGPNARRVTYRNVPGTAITTDPALLTTSSEGQSYGMMMAVYFALPATTTSASDQSIFDDLYQYVTTHRTAAPRATGLMRWHLDGNGNPVLVDNNQGDRAATDGDEDIAFSLIAAATKWGSSARFDYIKEARGIIDNLLTYSVDAHDVFSGNDNITPNDQTYSTNISYFAPAWYRLFQEATGATRWSSVAQNSLNTALAARNSTTGLVPDWCKWDGTASNASYGYDAFRTPWRCGIDYAWNNNQSSLDLSKKIGDFYQGIATNNVKAARNIDGTVTGNYEELCFLAGTASGVRSGTNFTAARNFYTEMTNISRTDYYNTSWQILGELFITGNLPDPRTWNRLTNADFEQNANYSRVITGWNKWSPNTGATATNASYIEQANGNHKGLSHITHYSPGPHDVFISQTKTGLNASATSWYRARAWVRNIGGLNAEFQVKNHVSNANTILVTAIPQSNDWKMVEIRFQAPTGQCTIGVRMIDTVGGKTFNVDDVTLIKE